MEVKKYLNIYWERIIIGIKESKEYKINFHMMNLFDIVHIVIAILFYSIFIDLIKDFLNWNLVDFTIYWLLNLLAWKILWMHTLRNFSYKLLRGDLNVYLTKPVSTYFQTVIHLVNGNNLISLIYIIPITLILISYNGYYLNLFKIFYFLFSWIYFIVIFNCLQSFGFFVKNSNLIAVPFLSVDETIWKYTPKLFENSNYSYLLFILPTSVHSYFALELLKGNTTLILNYLPFIIISFLFFLITLILLWHFGLKKYEAYG